MKKLGITGLVLSAAMAMGVAQAEPLKLTSQQMDQVSAGTSAGHKDYGHKGYAHKGFAAATAISGAAAAGTHTAVTHTATNTAALHGPGFAFAASNSASASAAQ